MKKIILVILLQFTLITFAQTGTVDTSFNPTDVGFGNGDGATGEAVRLVSVQSDGKILIAGDINSYNGTLTNNIARLNVDGSLDTSFNTGTGISGSIYSLAIQSDGKILIGGYLNSYNEIPINFIARLNGDGSLDTSFNIGTGFNSEVRSIAVQSDGKILIGGEFTSYNGTAINKVARLNIDGTIDTSFNVGISFNNGPATIVIQSDGKIFIGGYSTLFNGSPRAGIARLNTSGSLDTSFDIGTVFFANNPSIALQSDGKILVGGIESLNEIATNNFVRLNQDGSLDNSFNTNSALNYVNSITIQNNGKILIGGEIYIEDGESGNTISQAELLRLNADGSDDISFKHVRSSSSTTLSSLVLQSDDKILIGGVFLSYNGTSSENITRLNADGSIDTLFNKGSGANDAIDSMVIQPDGKILIGGRFNSYNAKERSRIARLNYDGSLDTSFDVGSGFNNDVSAIALQSDGKILVAGGFIYYKEQKQFKISRLTENGSIDYLFNQSTLEQRELGIFPGPDGNVSSIVVQPDGKILILGEFDGYNGIARHGIARLNSDGSLDTSFNLDYINVVGSFGGNAIAMALQSNGKILVVYTTYQESRILRLNSDGSLDNTFNVGTGANGYIASLVIQSDDKIVVGGRFTSYNSTTQNRITRLNADGSVDTGFIIGTGANSHVYSLAVQSDGKILIGGEFTSYNGNTQNTIARLNIDGSLDTSFNVGTGTGDYVVHTFAFQSDGKILIGGGFTSYNGTGRNRIARINGAISEPVELPLVGQGFTVNGISYIVTKATLPYEVAVGSNINFVGVATIPITVSDGGNSFDVTSISNFAFSNSIYLTSVTIPNSITSIGNKVFKNCSSLTSVTIPNSATSIGESAFYGCTGLTSVAIPNSVTSIGQEAFSFCRGLTSVSLPNSIASIGQATFYNCSSLTSVTIPNSVTSIEEAVFRNCSSLTSVTIPNSVTSIGSWAFQGCGQLDGVILPNSLTSIGERVFNDTGLTSVSIPNSVTHIGDGAFRECNNLTSVTIPNSVTHIGDGAFYRCQSLTSVTIPNSVTHIGNSAFYRCESLTSVTIPNSVISINDNVFQQCTGLTSVTIGNSVTSIGGGAFLGCESLTSVSIPNSVTNIDDSAFSNCLLLTEITISNSVTRIGSNAFAYCESLTTVTVNWTTPLPISDFYVFDGSDLSSVTLQVPAGTEIMYDSAPVWTDFNIISAPVESPVVGQTFAANGINYIVTKATLPYEVAVGSNTSFVGVATIPATVSNTGDSFAVTSIGEGAFDGCTGLTSVTVPNSVTSIGNYAFIRCIGLTSVTIPNSVASIGEGTFAECTGLTSISIPNSVTSIGNYAFIRCIGLTSLTIPNSVASIGEGTFAECTSLTSVSIPNSVISIGVIAFSDCTSLTTVSIPNSVTSIGIAAFQDCTGLTSVTVNWSTPLFINSNVFSGLNLSTLTLNIPAGTTTAYDVAAVWTDFNAIVEPVGPPVVGQTFAANGINYIVTKATLPYEVAVGSNSGFIGDAIIPATVSNIGNSYAVKIIGDYAFYQCRALTSVSIPNSVTSIGEGSFQYCIGLTSVVIPNSVTSIDERAFEYCAGLTSVTIPNSVEYIGRYAFSSCTSLTSVAIPNSVTSIGNRAFGGCTALNSVSIPNSVTSISDLTFDYCPSLTSVAIPNSVTSIGNGAFRDCSSLTSLSIPNSVTTIGGGAFYRCAGLTSVIIPNSVTSIGQEAFTFCTGLTSVNLPNSITSINIYTFGGCSSLTSVTIPNSVISIGELAFNECIGLTSVTIPNSVTSIGRLAFGYCSGLISVTIPNSVTNIGELAFYECTVLTTVAVDWQTPLAINGNVFGPTDTITLNIPAGTESAYEAAPIWRNFGTITPKYTAIPDSNFEQALFDLGFDTVNGDQKVLSSAISVITDLDVSNKAIVDLSGITDFVNLQSLTCVGNQLTSLDLRGLTNLIDVDCQFNPPLSCISVDDVAFATSNFLKDATTSFSTNCFGNSTVTYCRGAIAEPLSVSSPASIPLKWYTVATRGTASLIAPTPSTTTVGTRNYYASQVVGGVESARVVITVTVNPLPTTPGTISTSDAVLCKYIGTTNEVTYAVPAVAGTAYNWSTPEGVNIIADASATDNSITVNFLDSTLNNTNIGGVGTISVSAISSVGSCASASRSLALSSRLPTAPASLTLTSGDTTPHFNLRDVGSDPVTFSFVGLNALAKITKVGPYIDTETIFTLTAPPAATAASYSWTLPEGVNPIGDVTGNEITVDFAGVAPGIGTLPIAVQSVGGCGQSLPRALNLTRVFPTAPTALMLTESPSGTALTRVSPYTGKTTELTLTATPVLVQGATATSFAWILPTGVNCITPNTPTVVKQSVNTGTFTPEGAPIFEFRDFTAISTGTASTITIDFADVASGTLSFPLTVFAVNGTGNSKARTRTVTSAAPATPGAITTPLLAAPKFNPTCATSTTIMVQVPAVAGATYAWTVAGGTERIVSGNGGNSIIVNVAGVTTTTLSVSVVASNGTGSSLPRTLAIGKTIVCSAKIAPETEDTLFDVKAYPNPTSSEFTIETSAKGAINVKVYDMAGRLVEKADTNQVGSKLAAGTYNLIVNQGANTKSVRVIKK